MTSQKKLKIAYAVFLGIFIVLSALASELLLRELRSRDRTYHVWRKNMRRVFHPLPGVLPGIEGEGRFTTNSEGLRADEFDARDRFRILTLGGSTTEGLYLDDEETWPRLLQNRLNQRRPENRVWVGNAGRAGLTSREHVLQSRHLLRQYAGKIDLVLVLCGINDLSARLAHDKNYDPNETALLSNAFLIHPKEFSFSSFKQTAWGDSLRDLKWTYLNFVGLHVAQDDNAESFEAWRKARQQARIFLTEMPDLETALREYSDNLRAIIRAARENRAEIMLMTQPSIFRPGLTDEVNKLLWFGGIGPTYKWQTSGGGTYYSVEAMARGMRLYNQALLAVCAEEKVRCLDLDAALPRDLTVFYDDVHFNENGARLVAEKIDQGLKIP